MVNSINVAMAFTSEWLVKKRIMIPIETRINDPQISIRSCAAGEPGVVCAGSQSALEALCEPRRGCDGYGLDHHMIQHRKTSLEPAAGSAAFEMFAQFLALIRGEFSVSSSHDSKSW